MSLFSREQPFKPSSSPFPESPPKREEITQALILALNRLNATLAHMTEALDKQNQLLGSVQKSLSHSPRVRKKP